MRLNGWDRCLGRAALCLLAFSAGVSGARAGSQVLMFQEVYGEEIHTKRYWGSILRSMPAA